jgi:hypothetical protein
MAMIVATPALLKLLGAAGVLGATAAAVRALR